MNVHIDYPEGFRPKRFVKKLTKQEIGRITEATLLANGFLERLKELLNYNAETGEFRWKVSRGKVKAGSVAGSFDKGYCHIMIDGRNFRAHRLAWLWMKSEWPQEEIDHREQVTGSHFDNRFENLRESDRSENNRNQKLKANNASGYFGVSFAKYADKWRADITVNSKQQNLGYFGSAEDAARAYDERARELHGSFAKQNFPEEAA